MTVRELIAKLQDMPPESQVVSRESDGGLFTVEPEDVTVEMKAFYPTGRNGGWGYWETPWDGSEPKMVVVIAP